MTRLARPQSDSREELQILMDRGFSEDHALNALRLSDGTIGVAVELMQHFKEIILISGDGKSGGRGENLSFVPPLKRAWVKVPTDIKPPLTPQNVVDRDYAQHKDSKELGKSLPSSGGEVVVPSDYSGCTYLLSPTASSGISEVNHLALDRPLPPDTDPVIISGDIPPLLSLTPLHSDSAEDENGGGGSRNIDEEGVIFETISYAVEDPEDPDLFIAERVPSAMESEITLRMEHAQR